MKRIEAIIKVFDVQRTFKTHHYRIDKENFAPQVCALAGTKERSYLEVIIEALVSLVNLDPPTYIVAVILWRSPTC